MDLRVCWLDMSRASLAISVVEYEEISRTYPSYLSVFEATVSYAEVIMSCKV